MRKNRQKETKVVGRRSSVVCRPRIPTPVLLKVYTDGACSGNPGPSSVGISLQDREGNVICEVSETIGYATNNVAEYMACIIGLIEALKIGIKEGIKKAQRHKGTKVTPETGRGLSSLSSNSVPLCLCASVPFFSLPISVSLFSDSELMIRQLQGVYSVKSADLLPLHTTAKKLLGLFTHVELKSIPREANMRADFLAKQALKQNHKATKDRRLTTNNQRPTTKNQSEIANLKQQGVLL